MANDQSIETLKGIGEKTAKLFEKVGIRTIDDLLHYYPKGYDRSVETERQRIARELHDSTTQNLTAIVHKTELCSNAFITIVCKGMHTNLVYGCKSCL